MLHHILCITKHTSLNTMRLPSGPSPKRVVSELSLGGCSEQLLFFIASDPSLCDVQQATFCLPGLSETREYQSCAAGAACAAVG